MLQGERLKIMINTFVKDMNTTKLFKGKDVCLDMQIRCLCQYTRMLLTCLFLFLFATIPHRVFSVELSEDNISAKKMFNKVQDKLVIVEGSNGRGSGFVAKDSDGVKYFYTNKHVVEGQRKIAARLLKLATSVILFVVKYSGVAYVRTKQGANQQKNAG